MKKISIEGIVLNETNYGETSKILNILTKEYGYISVISKGCRTLKNKNRGVSLLLSYATYTLNYKENGISNLIEGNTIEPLKNILTDFEKMNYATYLINLCKKILKDNNDKTLYSLLKNALLKINANIDPSIITNIMEIKVLDYLGVKPNFTNCLKCGTNDILTFDISIGGMVCKNCYQDTYIFQEKTLKLLKLFQEVDISKIDKITVSLPIKKEINDFIKEYYDTYTGIYLKNKDKIQDILKI